MNRMTQKKETGETPKDFLPGDLVTLRSPSGPVMVVGGWESDGLFTYGWRCFWMIQGAAHDGVFPTAVLRLADPGSRPETG